MSRAPSWANKPTEQDTASDKEITPAKVAQTKPLGRPKSKVPTYQKAVRYTEQAQQNTNMLLGKLMAKGVKVDDSELLRHLVTWAATAEEHTLERIAGFIELQQRD